MKFRQRRSSGFSMVSLLALALTSACSGADGDQGPAGPAGVDGKDGLPGPTGPAGAEGDPGATGSAGPSGAKGDPGAPGPTKSPRLLDTKLGGWVDATRQAINQMILDHGVTSASFDPKQRPVAVLDWDNTVVKNDIGDGTFAYAVKNDKILQPPSRDWGLTSGGLTADAKSALKTACDAAANPGQPLPTSTTPACAAEIMNVYYNGKTVGGLKAWTGCSSSGLSSTMSYSYAWVAQLFAGHRPEDVRSFARAALDENEAAPIGAKQTVGGVSLAGYIRIYDQIQDLAETLTENGFELWVVTASPQYVVDGISNRIGVPPNRVIGIRTMTSAGGKLTYDLEGCGPVADAQNTLITFDRGKRCWINKVIFDEPVQTQLDVNVDPKKRPVFVAGDSDTDIAMLKDATVLKLVIERGKIQTMCNALANYQGKWRTNPMFIDPKAPPTSPYACSTALDHDCNPIVDEAGNPIPNQQP